MTHNFRLSQFFSFSFSFDHQLSQSQPSRCRQDQDPIGFRQVQPWYGWYLQASHC